MELRQKHLNLKKKKIIVMVTQRVTGSLVVSKRNCSVLFLSVEILIERKGERKPLTLNTAQESYLAESHEEIRQGQKGVLSGTVH